jgi:hypothetical protein
MRKQMNGKITKSRSKISCLATIVLLAITLGAHPVAATTYISVEPIPSRDVVGQNALAMILTIGYPNLELWSNRLLNDCGFVQNVIDVLALMAQLAQSILAIPVFLLLREDLRQ